MVIIGIIFISMAGVFALYTGYLQGKLYERRLINSVSRITFKKLRIAIAGTDKPEEIELIKKTKFYYTVYIVCFYGFVLSLIVYIISYHTYN